MLSLSSRTVSRRTASAGFTRACQVANRVFLPQLVARSASGVKMKRRRSVDNAESDRSTPHRPGAVVVEQELGNSSPETGTQLLFQSPNRSFLFAMTSVISGLQLFALTTAADTLLWYNTTWSQDAKMLAIYGCFAAGTGVVSAITYFRRSYVAALRTHGTNVEIDSYSWLGRLRTQVVEKSNIYAATDAHAASSRWITFRQRGKTGRYVMDVDGGTVPDIIQFQAWIRNHM